MTPIRGLNTEGSIEGLPLYMIILVTITAVALVSIIVLIPRPVIPARVSIEPSSLCWDKPAVVIVTVFSKDGRPINEARVELDGASIAFVAKSRDGGKVFAHVIAHTADPNPEIGTVTVAASFGGARVGDSIPVKPCPPTPIQNREEAAAVVLSGVVHPEEYPNLEVYGMESPLQPGQEVEAFWNASAEDRQLLATVDRESFLFFVDTQPGDRFEHLVKIALVATDDGDVTAFDAEWWPVIDGVERWHTRESRDAPGEKVFSKVDAPKPVPPSSRGLAMEPTGGTVPSYCRPQDIQKWALAVSASNDAAVDPRETDNFASLLTTYGYNARALKPSTMPAGWATVQSTLAAIRQSIMAAPDGGYCDEFVFIWAGHGARNGWMPIHNATSLAGWVTGTDLAREVDKTTELIRGMQVRVDIDVCFGGQHIQAFKTVMPPDPNANTPDKIFRDVYVMTSVTAFETAVGSALIWDSFTVDLQDCIKSQRKVDFRILFDCAKPQSWIKTPQQANWWNDGK